MGIKQKLQGDHIPVNKYTLIIDGIGTLTFTKISGIQHTLDVVDLPDRTKAPGGNAQAGSFTAMQPMHHMEENVVMETWHHECQDPISSSAKKAATLIMESGTGNKVVSFTLDGLWPSERKLPDLEWDNEGNMAAKEWTFQYDDINPI